MKEHRRTQKSTDVVGAEAGGDNQRNHGLRGCDAKTVQKDEAPERDGYVHPMQQQGGHGRCGEGDGCDTAG